MQERRRTRCPPPPPPPTHTHRDALSLNPTFVNPSLLLIYVCVLLLSRNLAEQPPLRMAPLLTGAAALGAATALAAEYLTALALGGAYAQDTVAKARRAGGGMRARPC